MKRKLLLIALIMLIAFGCSEEKRNPEKENTTTSVSDSSGKKNSPESSERESPNYKMMSPKKILELMNRRYPDVDSSKLSLEYLVTRSWGPNIGEMGMTLIFIDNYQFISRINYEGGEYIYGSFRIAGEMVHLKIEGFSAEYEDKNKEPILQLYEESSPHYYSKYLKSDELLPRFWDGKSTIKKGEAVTIDGVAALSEIGKRQIAKDTVFYISPNERGGHFIFKEFKGEVETDWSRLLSDSFYRRRVKGGVTIIAKSKSEIGGQDWYYIRLPISMGGYDRIKVEGAPDFEYERDLAWIKASSLIE